MSKEEVLAAFDLDIKNGDPKVGDATTEDIKNTAKRLIVHDRAGVIEVLRYWLDLRDIGLTPTALSVITNINIPELKSDVELLKTQILSGDIFHPSYIYLVDLALKALNGLGEKRRWECSVKYPSAWVTCPTRYSLKESKEKWVNMQVRILNKVHEKLPENYVYVRFNPNFPSVFDDVITAHHGKLVRNFPGKKIFLVPNCQNHELWKRIFYDYTFSHGENMFFMFNHQPADWPDTIRKTKKQ